MKQAVLDSKGAKIEDLELREKLFHCRGNDGLFNQVTVIQQGNQRQVSAKVKDRSEVRGGGKKPWRQKGTGRARIGSIRNPSRVHGSKAFGPKPHKYEKKVNKKVKQIARRSVLSQKVSENNFMVLDNVVPGSSKTSEFSGLLKNLNLSEKKVTILTGNMDDNLYFGSRNIKNICVIPAHSASTYDLLDCQLILADVASVEILNNQLSN